MNIKNGNFKNLTLLYVEDEDFIRQNAVEYLSRVCDNVLEAKDGQEALKVYRDHKPDIIISDIKMPKMNGLEMTEQIRKRDKETPIIIATAHTETAYLLKAVELQLIKYIVKPITSMKLTEALNMACHFLESKEESLIKMNERTLYDRFNKTLLINNTPVKLTKNEGLLLELLTKYHQRAITYSEIENYIWQGEGMSMDALRSLVRVLRKKLEGEFVENVSGVGYRLIFD
jgi:DNA-binding response OmpR family regulator